ncbi:MAG TPA: XTP/dITP diphosphatase [Chitinivibrionales bacterium]|nr:XTP/dITP diphosphatase [Chitinivibrionales bacterium]
MHPVIVATNNQGKLREIKEILSGAPFELTALKDHFDPVPSIPETGKTFYENAALKARWVFDRKKIWSLADDSGLQVDCLNGMPGVQSARYAGEHATDQDKVKKLLAAMKDCPPEKRTARFRCVIVMKFSDNDELCAEGVCEGSMGYAPEGTNGFGYDPVFFPKGYDRTFAQLDAVTKNAISHRGKALAALWRSLHDRFGKEWINGRD